MKFCCFSDRYFRITSSFFSSNFFRSASFFSVSLMTYMAFFPDSFDRVEFTLFEFEGASCHVGDVGLKRIYVTMESTVFHLRSFKEFGLLLYEERSFAFVFQQFNAFLERGLFCLLRTLFGKLPGLYEGLFFLQVFHHFFSDCL